MAKFKFDATKFEEIMKDYAEIVEKTIPDAVALSARLLCVELARRTQPFGNKAESGIGRTTKDIQKIIKDDSHITEMIGAVGNDKIKARLNTLLAAKRYDVLKIVFSNIGFLNKWGGMEITSNYATVHQANRNARTGRTKARGSQLYIAASDLQPYIDGVVKRVGIAKSGWARCAEQLPQVISGSMTRGIPSWVSDQSKSNGSITNNLDSATNPRVTLTNSTPWASQILPPGEQVNATSIVVSKMKAQMNRILKKREKTLTE
jgi:hypothetical protein